MYRVCRFMVIVGHLKVTVYILDYQLDTLGLAIIQSVPQLSIHFVSIILIASTHPKCRSWGSFEKFRKFAT